MDVIGQILENIIEGQYTTKPSLFLWGEIEVPEELKRKCEEPQQKEYLEK